MALVTLAAVVVGALSVQATTQWLGGAWLWVNVAVLLSLPLLVATILRPHAGVRIFAAAGILLAGLLLPVVALQAGNWTSTLTPNAMVAAGMLWILGTRTTLPTRGLMFSSAILALAFAASTFI